MDYASEPAYKPTILVVDDTPDNLSLMSGLLKDNYKLKVANSGEKALKIARSDTPPDLILLDVMMPEMSGYEVCTALKDAAATRDIPVIFLTAIIDMEEEKHGLDIGAVDYITKPINPPVVLARVATHIKIKASTDFLKDKNQYLEQEVARRTRDVAAIQDVTILAMASLAETRNSETSNHIRRTQHYVKALAGQLKDHPRFHEYLDDATIDLLYKSTPLHDIGKIGIPDHILLKPGKLTADEFEIIKTHSALGRDAIQAAEDRLGMEVAFLQIAKEMAYTHQEKWDGSGYPKGLSGDDIPISGRLMAVADVYDALIRRRVYKGPVSHDVAMEIMREGRGTHFDPDVLDAFVTLEKVIVSIVAVFRDAD
jgi:putative two-component system response regulator